LLESAERTARRRESRNRCGRRLRCQRRRDATCSNHGHLTTNQIGRQRRHSIVLAFRPAVFDRGISTLDIAGFAQTLSERSHHARIRGGRCTVEKPNHRHSRLLRRRCERPGRCVDCEFCRDDSHARSFLTDLRKIILRVFAISEFSHSLGHFEPQTLMTRQPFRGRIGP
jgi:hypothetical protein